MFEYDMFGYVKYQYSNADPNGSRGVLLNNIGGVIFLDEIGEASPKIQKIARFLDDYLVRPRGWRGTFLLPCSYCLRNKSGCLQRRKPIA